MYQDQPLLHSSLLLLQPQSCQRTMDILMAQSHECLTAPLIVQGQKALIHSSPQAQIQDPHTAFAVQEIPHALTHAPQEVRACSS